jgi:hypothetical protein
MALPESRFRYSGLASPNLGTGANLIMQGLQVPGKLSAQIQEQDRNNLLLNLKKQEAQQGQQLFDLKLQEQNRLNQERAGKELLASELMKLPTQKSSTSVVSPGVTQADVNSARNSMLNTQYETAGDTYAKEFARLTAPIIPEEQSKAVANVQPVSTDNSSLLTYKGKPVTFDSISNTLQNPLTSLDNAVKEQMYGGSSQTPTTPELTQADISQAHKLALEKAGLSDNMVGKEFTVAEDKLPKISKEVTKTSMKDLSDTEIKQGKLDLIRRLANEGSIPSTMALEVANKINAPKSQKEQLDELKYLLDVKEQSRKDKELEAKIKSGYFGKSSSGKGFSFGEQLYTAAGPDGLDAARDYMSKNKGSLDNMSTGDKKELLAYLTAKYGHENDWFNWTGWYDLK